MRKPFTKHCQNCGKEFTFLAAGSEKEKRKFCSSVCNGNYYADKLSRDRKGKGNPMFGKKPWNLGNLSIRKKYKIETGAIMKTKSGSRKNVYFDVKTDKGWKKLHRIIIEKKIGRPLAASEVVHHIDGNGLNNNLSNLKLMSKSEHAKVHKMQKNFERGDEYARD